MHFVLILVAACSSPEPVASPPRAAPVATSPEAPPPEVATSPEAPPPTPAPVVPAPVAPAPVATTPAPTAPVSAAPVAAPDPAAKPTAADYTLVPAKNALYVVVKYERGTLGANLAHDHVIVATSYSGTVHWDPANPAACKVSVDVPTNGLHVDPPGARARAGLEGSPPESDHPKIEANFNGDKQLDSGRFPVLKFRSTSCAAAEGGKYTVSGDLTVHGVARPTTVTMAITTEGEQLSASGRFVAKHADFGMNPFTAAMGSVRNSEPLTFVLDLAGTRQ